MNEVVSKRLAASVFALTMILALSGALLPGCGPKWSVDPSSLDFGLVPAGSASDRSFTIKNSGRGTIAGDVTEGCGDFSILSGGGRFTLAEARSRTVVVRFAPTSVGSKACAIVLGGGGPNVRTLGTGVQSASGQLEVVSDPAGADILLDGVRTEQVTPHVFFLSPGVHSASVEQAGVTFSPPNCAADISDQSHAVCSFTGPPPCSTAVMTPPAGASLRLGSSAVIVWIPSGPGGAVRIELIQGEVSRCTIAESAANSGSFGWTIDDCGGGAVTTYRIRVTELSGTRCSGESGAFGIH
ncbi:MAG TPA: hypothetical protein VER38_01345 [Candidatus Eisenbacteria bacterium]|nr:hypothetical protein [Candidatus Eisenbacteria bacterium]